MTILRKRLAGRMIVLGGLALGLGLGGGAIHVLWRRSPPPATYVAAPLDLEAMRASLPNVEPRPGRAAAADRPLAPGRKAPGLRAAGWLNAPADGPPDVSNHVVV